MILHIHPNPRYVEPSSLSFFNDLGHLTLESEGEMLHNIATHASGINPMGLGCQQKKEQLSTSVTHLFLPELSFQCIWAPELAAGPKAEAWAEAFSTSLERWGSQGLPEDSDGQTSGLRDLLFCFAKTPKFAIRRQPQTDSLRDRVSHYNPLYSQQALQCDTCWCKYKFRPHLLQMNL